MPVEAVIERTFEEDAEYMSAPSIEPTSPVEAIAPSIPGVSFSDQAIASQPTVAPHHCLAREVVCRIVQDERSHRLLERMGFFTSFLQILDEENATKRNNASLY